MKKLLIRTLIVTAAGIFMLGDAFAQQTPASNSPQAQPAPPSQQPAQKPGPAATTDTLTIPGLPTAKDKASYAIGMNIGKSFQRDSVDINADALLLGIKDAMAGGKTLMTDDQARAVLAEFQAELNRKRMEKMQELADANKKEGEAFLAANKTKEGVVTLPSGLQYKILTEGTGPKPTAADMVVCNYKGTLINNTEFDSSYKRGQPATFAVTGVIKGWTEALQLMPVGSKWQLFVPAELAYGPRGAGPTIGPNSTLIFEIELLSIKPKPQPPTATPGPKDTK